ncbi:ABC transporter substrate-binding protein [Psychrobacter sp. UBA2514]|jgi:putative ABC transport system substrate-binding protein|uniref:ABC transporter substrate-binding protein n=1 Tax=Psychrobacter sp. UBA2514 TaxID=1947346 RepID=UPI00257DEDF0|nr:ABC transporter substrate-binding protein [Psychrobacter sp. UBA2514]|tara:strand:- start:4881 stop:5945 length:1065 start_codon:yes stop_codon:yes gene_type:complete
MTIASTLRLSLYGVALSAISTLGLIGCSNSSTDTAATTENSSAADAEKPAKSIAITQIVEHPSLYDMRRGIIDELADNGYVEGQNLTVNFQSAQGNTATAGQIAKQFAGDNPDAIVAISTPSAQSIVAATTTIPIIYTAVSDPLGAKLINEDGKPFQSNLTGLSSQLPLEPQLDLLQQIKPEMKTIGYVYSPGEANSVSLRDSLKQALPARDLTLLDIPANRPTDIGMATRSLQGRADIIYTSFDNNVASAFEAMTQAANELKLPIVASDEFSVKRGAAAALGVNDYDFGRTTGKMVYRVLNGEAINNIEPAVMNDLTLYISPKHAKTQGVSLPAELLKNGINVDEQAQSTDNK